MSAAALLILLAPVLTAFLLLDATLRESDGSPAPLALRLGLAVGLGLGIASCAFFVALLLFDGARAAVATIDSLLLIGATAVRSRSRRASPPTRSAWTRLDRWLLAALGGAVCLAVVIFAGMTWSAPHGQWDAWATWNLRARALFRGGPDWRLAFLRPNSVIGYPLLVPASVARAWVYLGAEPVAVPIAVAGLFATGTVLVLVGALSALRDRAQALIAGLCLVGTPLFLTRATWQYADLPVAYFYLAALILLVRADAGCGSASELFWAGLATALAVWTKDEGVAFVAAVVAVRLVIALRDGRSAWRLGAWFAAGAAPVGLLWSIFKLQFGGDSHRLRDAGGATMTRLLDPTRLAILVREVAGELLGAASLASLLAVIAYAALMGPSQLRPARAAAWHAGLVLMLVALAYGAIYLQAPHLVAVVDRSLDRLLLQLWPSALLAALLWTASPTERQAE